jgi:hypothetical protein
VIPAQSYRSLPRIRVCPICLGMHPIIGLHQTHLAPSPLAHSDSMKTLITLRPATRMFNYCAGWQTTRPSARRPRLQFLRGCCDFSPMGSVQDFPCGQRIKRLATLGLSRRSDVLVSRSVGAQSSSSGSLLYCNSSGRALLVSGSVSRQLSSP